MLASSLCTLAGLFGPQAVSPVLMRAFEASPAQTSFAVNAVTIGMAAGGLLTPMLVGHLPRKRVIVASLLLLSVPSGLLALGTSLAMIAALRAAQGVLMATCFAVTIAYVAEHWGASGQAPRLMAAYVTGNVVSNILGRVVCGTVTEWWDWHAAFLVLALLPLAGGLVLVVLLPPDQDVVRELRSSPWAAVLGHVRDPRLAACFVAGSLILFCFLGVFNFVNYRLAAPPFALPTGQIGLLYFVFAPSVVLTPLTGRAVAHFGHPLTLCLGALTAMTGVLLTLPDVVGTCLLGMALVGLGSFVAQAVATSYVGLAARYDRPLAGGMYLAAYYTGGAVSSAALGHVFGWAGWDGIVGAVVPAVALMAVVGWSFWRGGLPGGVAAMTGANVRRRYAAGSDGGKAADGPD